MKLILTRHGETIENKKGIMQGQMHGHLSKLGKQQANKLAKRLAKENIDFIYSSDLRRAADTAKEIKKYHPETPIKFVKELRERSIGKLTGMKRYEMSDDEYKKNSEPISKIKKRARMFLHKIYCKHKKNTVLFVSHGAIGMWIAHIITKKPREILKKKGNLKNTSISIFNIKENKKHKMLVFNCTKHLK